VSQVLQKVFAALREEGLSKEEIAETLRVHPTDIDELVFGLALTSLDGIPRRGDRGRSWPSLALVSSKD
jgi:hypothetical protein